MAILEDLKSYQRQLTIWCRAIKAANASDGNLVLVLMELLPLQRKPPGKIVSVAIDCLLRAVYNAKDLDEWGRIVSGQSERLPQSLTDIVGGDFFDEKQVSAVMSFVLDLLRGSDKLADLIAFLKVLRSMWTILEMQASRMSCAPSVRLRP